MSLKTKLLELFKYEPDKDGAQTFNIQLALNDNWDKIEAWAQSVKTALTKLVPTSRKVNGKTLAEDVTLTGENIAVSSADSTPISGAVKYRTNPNLLDNWYFGNPVNQRGQTEYTEASKYVIDRWWLQLDTSLSIVDGGVKISGKWDIEQFFENTLPNATYTLSMLYKDKTGTDDLRFIVGNRSDGDIKGVNTKNASGLLSFTVTSDIINKIIIGFSGSTDNSVTLLAAKLELGDTQTLAHKENGVWVLNEIPDFGEQLARCQRYAFSPLYEAYATAVICNLFISRAADGVAFGEVTLPVSMRNKPVFSGNASKFWIVAENGGGASHPTAISVMGLSADKVMIQVNGSYTANTQYILYVDNPFTSADFLLSADL